MASGRKASAASSRGSRENRERARVYQARAELNAQQIRRRIRDNVVAGVVGGVLVLGSVGAMTAYYLAGPGVPAVTPTPSPTVGTIAPESPVPAPTETVPAPTPPATPAG